MNKISESTTAALALFDTTFAAYMAAMMAVSSCCSFHRAQMLLQCSEMKKLGVDALLATKMGLVPTALLEEFLSNCITAMHQEMQFVHNLKPVEKNKDVFPMREARA